MGFPNGSVVKNQSAMQETQIQEDPQEEGMAIHSSILAWDIPWTEKPGRATVHGAKKIFRYDLATKQQQQTTQRLNRWGWKHGFLEPGCPSSKPGSTTYWLCEREQVGPSP